MLRALSFVRFVSFVVNNVFVSSLQPRLAPLSAPARNQLLAIRVVVVGKLLARVDITRRADPDRLADDVAVAVWLARVVDEARQIAIDVRVTHPAAIHREAPDAPLLQVPCLALQALLVINQLACVINDACVLGDGFESEDAPAVDSRAPPRNSWKFGFTCHPQTG